MAALFDLDAKREAGPDATSVVGEAFDVIAAYLLELPGVRAIREIEKIRGRLDAVECQILAGYITDSGDTTRAENLAGSTGASKKTCKRKARRAKATKKNPSLNDKLNSGEMTSEHADIIASASDETDGAAGQDQKFIDEIAATDADQAARIARDYVTKHTDAAKAQSRHDRQRRRRGVNRFVTDDNLDAIMVKGDTESIDAMWNTLVVGANAMYKADCGRDVPGAQHPRTFGQRLYDTLVAAVTGRGVGTAGGSPTTNSDIATSSTSTSASGSGPDVASSVGSAPIVSKRYTAPKARPVIVVTVTLDKYLGLDPNTAAELIGVGPIADSVLAQYLDADPDIIAMLYGRDGQPLWLGRTARFATEAQMQALIVRDKCCVGCGKHHLFCEAHHLKPWNAPIRGQTDLTDLALLCPDCHHRLHADNQTLYRHRDGTWRTRPATANETPPQRANPNHD